MPGAYISCPPVGELKFNFKNPQFNIVSFEKHLNESQNLLNRIKKIDINK